MDLVLSLFPGIDLLGRGFEDEGFCVVRGPDLIFGGDIRVFVPPAGRFDGIIGGSPCQDFSTIRRDEPTGYGREMIAEFVRCVVMAAPAWWLLENVPGVPDVAIEGYTVQRLDVYASEFGLPQRRLRHIQFGSKDGTALVLERGERVTAVQGAVLASDHDTPWDRFCLGQGLPADFDLPSFTIAGKRAAVGNGVPLPMARGLAKAVRERVAADFLAKAGMRLCVCGCGRLVSGGARSAGSACRKRLQRRRDEPG